MYCLQSTQKHTNFSGCSYITLIEVATKRSKYRPYPPKSPPRWSKKYIIMHGAKRLLENLVHNLSVIVFVKTHIHYQQQAPAEGSGGPFRGKGYWKFGILFSNNLAFVTWPSLQKPAVASAPITWPLLQ